jgi:hypothetical protein
MGDELMSRRRETKWVLTGLAAGAALVLLIWWMTTWRMFQ